MTQCLRQSVIFPSDSVSSKSEIKVLAGLVSPEACPWLEEESHMVSLMHVTVSQAPLLERTAGALH